MRKSYLLIVFSLIIIIWLFLVLTSKYNKNYQNNSFSQENQKRQREENKKFIDYTNILSWMSIFDKEVIKTAINNNNSKLCENISEKLEKVCKKIGNWFKRRRA